jgi:hypothetical protein
MPESDSRKKDFCILRGVGCLSGSCGGCIFGFTIKEIMRNKWKMENWKIGNWKIGTWKLEKWKNGKMEK